MLPIFKVLHLPRQKDTSSLTIRLRFYDVSSRLSPWLRLKVSPKFCVLHRKHPSKWEEIVFVRKVISQSHETHPQQILSRYHMNARIVVNLLEEVHLNEDIGVNRKISPIDIPISSIVTRLNLPVELLGHLGHHRILSHCLRAQLLDTFITMRFNVLNLSIR